ncbi:hypothetical protein B0A48_03770 [Cryoendolithus antarcticus]|uniref:RING-type domain-containing protein n=1 Tax=Cryoendolithus antarcticus TaxID=1507870 RepID=A0A1V8TGG4_9PEZI|nr:hypothetical protein B0A48_03770 [Cryoendolithus antarcticus]
MAPMLLVSVLLLAMRTAAQDIAPYNWSGEAGGSNLQQLAISRGEHQEALSPILPFPSDDALPSAGLTGQLFPFNATSYPSFPTSQIALISCDSSNETSNINLPFLLSSALSANASAILLYTLTHDYCAYDTNAPRTYNHYFTTRTMGDAMDLWRNVQDAGAEPLYVMLGGPDVKVQQQNNGTMGGGQGNGTQQQNGPFGPSPSTAVAMIILYSITGVITGLFLIIIVTGAIRAHRHPERYGPRAMLGRGPRQSRARGLGRAILDTIPIVKFGDKEEAKPGDVELGAASTATGADAARTADANPETDGASREPSAHDHTHAEPQAEEGISAASTAPAADPQQGCSICTEDFELGQDQRLLPCNHRFHPECIDPWLLNVSSTCPLCRIDLRPAPAGEVDEDGNPRSASVAREGDELAPPLVAQPTSVRRSLMFAVMGVRRPENLSGEQRVEALRRYRETQQTENQSSRNRRQSALLAQAQGIHGTTAVGAAGESSADGTVVVGSGERTRDRLRRVLGVRTRRTGVEDVAAPEAPAATGATPATAGASNSTDAPTDAPTSGSRTA